MSDMSPIQGSLSLCCGKKYFFYNTTFLFRWCCISSRFQSACNWKGVLPLLLTLNPESMDNTALSVFPVHLFYRSLGSQTQANIDTELCSLPISPEFLLRVSRPFLDNFNRATTD